MADAKPQVYQEAVGFRITEAAQQKISMGALAAWLRKGELEAQEVQTAAYNKDAFRRALVAIRGMTEDPRETFVPAVRELCAEAGVAFCVVQEPQERSKWRHAVAVSTKGSPPNELQKQVQTFFGSRSSTKPFTY